MDFREVTEFLKDSFKYFIVAIVVILIFLYILSMQQVVGPSMDTTLHEGDIVLISKLNYKIGKVNRGDIVVFEYNGMKNLIKRVIGIPGDSIEYKDNKLYINGEYYTEDYLDEGITTGDFTTEDLGEKVIPDGYYLMLGDNRNDSMDSRDIGLVSEDDIIGRVVVRIWPLNKIGGIS